MSKTTPDIRAAQAPESISQLLGRLAPEIESILAHHRLTALDSSFLHLEDNQPSHMHVASVTIFDGTAPPHDELVEGIAARLHRERG